MSTSSTYVKWAAVTFDLAIFSKIRFRSPWIGIRCSAPPAATVTVGEGATTAVRGMLQRSTLGADMLKRLRVYAGAEHGHAAQRPRTLAFDEKGNLKIG